MSDAFRLVKIIDPQAIVTGGLVPKGAYNPATAYNTGDSVSYNGSSYVAIASTTGNLPTNTTYWQVLAQQGSAGAAGAAGAAGPTGPAGSNGLVTSVVGGTGVTVNSTTPSAPIVNAITATFTQPGIARSLVFNVKDYGATGNGVTDDTAAIKSAISAANSAGGGIVWVPQGTYLSNGTGTPSDGCYIIPDNVTIQGVGIGATTFKVGNTQAADVTGVFRTQYNTQNKNVTLCGFSVDGNGANQTGGIRIVGFYCGTLPGSTTTDTDITCQNVEIRNCTGYGFDPHERTTRLRILYCVSHDNGYGGGPYDGFTLDGQYEAEVIGCISYNNTRYGFNLTTASTNCKITDCEAYGNGEGGLTVANGSKYTSVTTCTFHDNGADGIFLNGIPNNAVGAIDTTPGNYNSVKGNIISMSGEHGIHVYGSSYNHISGNKIIDSSQDTTNVYSQIFVDDDNGSNISVWNTVIDNDITISTAATKVAKYAIGEAHSTDDNNYYAVNRPQGTYGTATLNLLGTNSIALASHNGVNEHTNLLSLTPPNGTTLTLGTGTGLQIGTASTQKVAFLGATPAVQQAATVDLGSVLSTFGQRAAGGTYVLTTSGQIQFTGPARYSQTITASVVSTGISATLTPGTSTPNRLLDATAVSYQFNLAATATAGYEFYIQKIDSSTNTVTVNAGSGNTINGSQTLVLTAQYQWVRVYSTSTSGVWYATQPTLAGYEKTAIAANFSPAASTTYYFGSLAVIPGTTAAMNKIKMSKAGRITAASIFATCTVGSAQTSTMSIRVNNTTDTTISSAVNLSASPYEVLTTGLNIPVAQGDYVEIKWVTPAWTPTLPTGVRIAVALYIEP